MHSFLKTLNNQTSNRTPIWLMRQAGRYLPEYRKVRDKAGSFLNLCKNPDLATEVTLQPLRRFDLDAAIVFSDILVVPEAMGLQLYFSEGEGPKFTNPIQTPADIDNLQAINPELELAYVLQTIKNLKLELPQELPLIGFSGSPWTLACYMIEGASCKNYEKIKAWLYTNPQQLHRLLAKLSTAIADYLISQIKAGVDTFMLFDSWGGILSEHAFQEFSLPYLKKVLNLIELSLPNHNIPSIVFNKGGGAWLDHLETIPCHALGIDWTIELAHARTSTNKVLQGNLDPAILSVADKSSLIKEVRRILTSYQEANNDELTGLIFNLGHGILPSAKPENIAVLVDTVHEFSRGYS